MKLRGILTTVFVTMSVVAIGAIGFWADYIVTQQTTQKVEMSLNNETLDLSNEINSWMAEKISMADTASIYMKSGVMNSKVETYLDQLLTNTGAEQSISDIYVGKTNGDMIDGSGAEFDASYDPRERDWYTAAIDQDQTVVTKPYLDMTTGKLAVSVATKLTSQSGVVEGVLGMDILIDTLNEKTTSKSFGETGTAMLLADDGTVISHPNEELVQQNIVDIMNDSTLTDKLLTEDSGLINYTKDGTRKIMVFNKIPTTNWIVAVSMDRSEAYAQLMQMQIALLSVFVVILILTIVVTALVANRIARPLKKLTAEAKKAAAGDLTVTIKPAGAQEIKELGGAFSDMIQNIGGLVGNIDEAANQVLASTKHIDQVADSAKETAEEVSRATNDLAEGATRQAESATEGAGKVSQMTEAINNITAYSESSKEVADNVSKIVSDGYSSLEKQMSLMNENLESTEKVKTAITLLNDKSHEIGEIVNIIAGIADETNLLALNASIEAARAGENGRGFAVVADQVGKLAEESANSSANIDSLLKDILDKTAQSVDDVNQVYSVVENQKESLEETRATYQEIQSSVENIVERIKHIADEAFGIKGHSDKIAFAIEDIAAITEESAAATEEVASSSTEQSNSVDMISEEVSKLVSEANELISMISNFTYEVGDSSIVASENDVIEEEDIVEVDDGTEV